MQSGHAWFQYLSGLVAPLGGGNAVERFFREPQLMTPAETEELS